MNDKELELKYRSLVKDPFSVHGIQTCNYKPHPFTIGPAHVAHAADHCGGMLGEETLSKIGCVWKDDKYGPTCGMFSKDHTCDHVLFLKLLRDVPNKEAAAAIFSIKQHMLDDGLDGVAFMESGFRIAPPEQ